jgi:hypothetical protein
MKDKPKVAEVLQELVASLTPQELEPRLELQVFVDPMTLLAQANQNQNQNQNQNKDVIDPGSGSSFG